MHRERQKASYRKLVEKSKEGSINHSRQFCEPSGSTRVYISTPPLQMTSWLWFYFSLMWACSVIGLWLWLFFVLKYIKIIFFYFLKLAYQNNSKHVIKLIFLKIRLQLYFQTQSNLYFWMEMESEVDNV